MRVLAVLALTLAACANGPSKKITSQLKEPVVAALENAPEIVLSSLHPYPRGYDEKYWEKLGLGGKEQIDDYAVLGQVTLDDQARREILAAFYNGINANDGRVAACFNPRHALTATHEGKRYDIVICYECLSMSVFQDGKHFSKALTNQGPARRFNKELDKASIPRQKKK